MPEVLGELSKAAAQVEVGAVLGGTRGVYVPPLPQGNRSLEVVAPGHGEVEEDVRAARESSARALSLADQIPGFLPPAHYADLDF